MLERPTTSKTSPSVAIKAIVAERREMTYFSWGKPLPLGRVNISITCHGDTKKKKDKLEKPTSHGAIKMYSSHGIGTGRRG